VKSEAPRTPKRFNRADSLSPIAKGKVTGVEFMDYVTPGTVIKLGPNDSIVLSYIKSCWRETITGGTVVVGVEQSFFHLSKVEGVKVDCDRGDQQVTYQQREVAGTAFRGLSEDR
jgi:hypothetical protein